MLTMSLKIRIPIHIVLFAIAVVVFYLGLGIGLSQNPAAGTALWAVAGSIGVLNLVWIVASVIASNRRSPA